MYDYVTMKNSKNVLYSIYVLEASRHTYKLLTNYFICPALIIRLGFIKLFLFVRIFWFNRQLVNKCNFFFNTRIQNYYLKLFFN